MSLKAIAPGEVKKSKIKFLIAGDPGCGKTWFSLDFPMPYLIDCESGAVREQYQEKLKNVGGAYFGVEQGADNFIDVIEEVKTLATTQHQFKTLIIDSFSHLYLSEAAEAEEKIGSEFGKDRKAANKPTRQLMRWINKCDLNVIMIGHNKAKWARKGNEIYQEGNTFDGYPKLEYDLDLYIEILPGYKNFIIKKSRIKSLPQGETMPLSYKKFAEIYGKETMEEASIPTELATPVQIKLIEEYIKALNISPDQIEKWFTKVDVDDFSEMTNIQIDGLLTMLKGKIEKLKGGK